MRITDKEAALIEGGRISAVIRWNNIPENIGDILFSIGKNTYRLTDKFRWTVHRCASQRGGKDWKCSDLLLYKATFTFLYGKYNEHKNEIVYLLVFKKDTQKSLEVYGICD